MRAPAKFHDESKPRGALHPGDGLLLDEMAAHIDEVAGVTPFKVAEALARDFYRSRHDDVFEGPRKALAKRLYGKWIREAEQHPIYNAERRLRAKKP